MVLASLPIRSEASEGKQLHSLSLTFSTAIYKSRTNLWLIDHNSAWLMTNALHQSRLELHTFPHKCLSDWEADFRTPYIGCCLSSGGLQTKLSHFRVWHPAVCIYQCVYEL
jgi:hypothetical protein